MPRWSAPHMNMTLDSPSPKGGSEKGDPTKYQLQHHMLATFKSLKETIFRMPLCVSPFWGSVIDAYGRFPH